MNFLSIIVLCFLFLQTFGRPAHILQGYKNSKDNSYRDSDSSGSDDYLHNEEKPSLKQFAGDEPDTKAEQLDENDSNSNEEVYNASPDKDYLENNDEEQAESAHLSHRDVLSPGNVLKRTPARNNGIMLFHNNEKARNLQKFKNNEDDQFGPNEPARYFKQENEGQGRYAVNRERRQIKNNDLPEPIETDEISTQKNDDFITNEDEEKAIRRHVKKLSQEELDELLQTLSEDKRALLKNIIDSSQQEYDSINKREITKKAGANEENNFVGNEQSDASKIHGDSANLEAESSISPDSEKEDNTKKADNNIESISSKCPEIESSSEKSSDKVNALDSIEDKKLVNSDNIESIKSSQAEDKKLVHSDSIENLKSSQTESNILANPDSEHELSKKGNKREINSKSFIQPKSIIEDLSNSESSIKEDSYCENEELSQLWNEDTNLYNANKYKREICSDDLDSITSLEESFPNADNINNIKPGSDMAPLVRVKRDKPDKTIEKRDLDILSNIKVPYFSSALESNEEESDEGSEFQDEGYFERRANIAKSGDFTKQGTDSSRDDGENRYCANSQPAHIDNDKSETDAASLGSDTDVVLSGIEGVDDNMMYNSVARMRRTGDAIENSNTEGENSKIKQENMPQLGSRNEDNEISEEYNNAPRYQENDSFGSLPRNYEQDLGRFKRIRRLKPESNVPVVEH